LTKRSILQKRSIKKEIRPTTLTLPPPHPVVDRMHSYDVQRTPDAVGGLDTVL